MKRIFSLLLCIIVLLSVCSCDSLSMKTTTLQDSMPLPDDGVVPAELFEQLKEQNGVVTLTGKSNGMHYEWTVFGSDIQTPTDCNMSLELNQTEDAGLSLRFHTDEEFGFSPVLSIYLNELWSAQSAVVYRRTNGILEEIGSASVTGSKSTILNYSVASVVGHYVIMPENRSILPEEQVPINTSLSEAARPSDDAYLSSVSGAQSTGESGGSSNSSYLTGVTDSGGRVLSDGKQTEQDQYLTDPVPAGKPLPVEPENQDVDENKTHTCSFSIECSTILNHLKDLDSEKLDEVPSNGVILAKTTVTFHEGESVFDVLQRVCRENGIQMEASWTPIYNSAYVEGIHNLYEFDCGSLSGWMYRVNGWYPNYGCSRYQLAQGDVVEWRYTCDLGNDIGGGYAVGD